MCKQNFLWEFIFNYQYYFNNKIVDVSIGIQCSLLWFSLIVMLEEQVGLYSLLLWIVYGNLQVMMKFDVIGDKFIWVFCFSVQFSLDKFVFDNKFNIGSCWSVCGFDGENSLFGNQGWYWCNDFIWDLVIYEW